MLFLSTLLLSLFITVSLMPVCRRFTIRMNGMDFPNQRKVHEIPMPKCGGIAMTVAILFSVLVWANGNEFVRILLLGALIICIFGIIDDFRNLDYKIKFLGQCVAALTVILLGGVKITSLGMLLPEGTILPGWVSVPLTLIIIVGVTNAVNLSDGLDGLAGGLSLLTFMFIAYLAHMAMNNMVFMFSIAIIGSIFGFLRFNTYPATLFMGDAGSQVLGFFAVTLSIRLTQTNLPYSPLLPLFLLGFPVIDTVTVMVERIVHKKSPFVADMNHFHHKLMRMGLYHTEAVFIIYLFQAILVTFAYVFRFYSEWFLLGLYAVFSFLVISGFFIGTHKRWQLPRSVWLDKVVKTRLRVLKEKQIVIKVSFGIIKVGLPVVLIFSCISPRSVHVYLSIASTGFLGLMMLTTAMKKEWAGTVLRMCLYLMIPFIIYAGQVDISNWMGERMVFLYHLSFALLVLFVVLTLKFTRRKKGFKISPMDFLILFIALVVPNLPDVRVQSHQMGMVAAKMIVLYFGFEVLIGELRGKLGKLTILTMVALAILGLRGIFVF